VDGELRLNVSEGASYKEKSKRGAKYVTVWESASEMHNKILIYGRRGRAERQKSTRAIPLCKKERY